MKRNSSGARDRNDGVHKFRPQRKTSTFTWAVARLFTFRALRLPEGSHGSRQVKYPFPLLIGRGTIEERGPHFTNSLLVFLLRLTSSKR